MKLIAGRTLADEMGTADRGRLIRGELGLAVPGRNPSRQPGGGPGLAGEGNALAAGHGRDEPAPDDAAKAKLRRQALDWLRANWRPGTGYSLPVNPGSGRSS